MRSGEYLITPYSVVNSNNSRIPSLECSSRLAVRCWLLAAGCLWVGQIGRIRKVDEADPAVNEEKRQRGLGFGRVWKGLGGLGGFGTGLILVWPLEGGGGCGGKKKERKREREKNDTVLVTAKHGAKGVALRCKVRSIMIVT